MLIKTRLIVLLGFVAFLFAGFAHAGTQKVSFQALSNYPPYKYMENGYLRGFDIELSNLLFNNEEYSLEFNFSQNWEYIYERLKDGEIDTCGLIEVSSVRKNDILFSKPLMKVHYSLFTLKNSDRITVDDLKKLKVGVLKGSYSEDILSDKQRVKNYYPLQSMEQEISELIQGKIDVIFDNQEVINYLIIKRGLKSEIIPQTTGMFPTDFAYGVSKDRPELVNYINKRIDQLKKSGAYEELYEKYFFSRSQYYIDMHRRNITIVILISGLCAFLIMVFLYANIAYLRKRVAKATRDLKEQYEWVHTTLSSIGDAVLATDRDGNVNFMNLIAREITGASNDGYNGRYIWDVITIVDEAKRTPVEIPISNVISAGTRIKMLQGCLLISDDGRELHVSVSVSPIRDDKGDITGAVMVLRDITTRIIAENLLRHEKEFSDNIINNSNTIIMLWKPDGTVIRFNRFGESVTGFSSEEIIGRKWFDVIIPAEDRPNIIPVIERAQEGEVYQKVERKNLCKDGSIIDVLWTNSILHDDDGKPNVIVGMGIDVTERKRAERKLLSSYRELEAVHEELAATEEELKQQFEALKIKEDALKVSEERYRLAVEGVDNGIWDWDIENDIVYLSDNSKQIMEVERNENFISYSYLYKLICNEDIHKFKSALIDYFSGRANYFLSEFRVYSDSLREYKWLQARGKAVWNSDGKPVRIAGSLTDITERKKSEERIHFMAYYDSLTCLPNRTHFLDRLNLELARSRRRKQIGALLFLDLDNFKSINDTLGHSFGDTLLENIGILLRKCLREVDLVARLGGDEFIILLPEIDSFDAVISVAERILEAFQKPWMLGEKEFYITTSMGITFYPIDGEDDQTLLKNADTAMYRAKEVGKNTYQLYTSAMNVKVVEKVNLQNSLRHALEHDELMVYYQPQIGIATGEITGVEALVRWNHPIRGVVLPDDFIPFAEESDAIIQIGEIVLEKAMTHNRILQGKGFKPLRVAVNLSVRQFQQKNLVEMITRILNRTGMDPAYLELEITESVAMQNIDFTIETINRLREMGIRISLDDFGTGYSSLNYLKLLPINTLKIDKSFVHDMTENSDEEAIAKAVISLAHSLKVEVTAEGVETEAQLQLLKEYDCDNVQGYLFSEPLPFDELEKLLKKSTVFL